MDLGQVIREHRLAAEMTHAVLAKKAGLRRETQLSVIELGYNVESVQYAQCAKGLGFRSALEMFRSRAHDPLARHLERVWLLLDEPQKKRALRWLNNLLIEG